MGLAGCSAGARPATPTQTAEPANAWAALLARTPFPYASPLPPAELSSLDGSYTKIDPEKSTPVPCIRCPDYLPEGGIWKLSFERGVYRLYHPITGWRAIASFTVSGDQLLLFNDPNCPDVVGRYTWRLAAGVLTLAAVDDPCSIGLRADNLGMQPWLACRPPNAEAAISDHWDRPAGCD